MRTRIERTPAILALLCVCAVGPTTVWAQTPALTPVSVVVPPQGTVAATVTGPAGQNFAVIGSRSNAGFSYGGVALDVGTDVAVLAVGVIAGSGTASVFLTPPFQGTSPDRYYVQAVTSASPDFTPLAKSNSVALRNAAVVGNLPVAAVVNPNGSLQSASEGITASRVSFGRYRIDFAPGLVPAPFLPMVMPIGARILGHFYSPTGIDLELDSDAYFHVMVFPARP